MEGKARGPWGPESAERASDASLPLATFFTPACCPLDAYCSLSNSQTELSFTHLYTRDTFLSPDSHGFLLHFGGGRYVRAAERCPAVIVRRPPFPPSHLSDPALPLPSYPLPPAPTAMEAEALPLVEALGFQHGDAVHFAPGWYG